MIYPNLKFPRVADRVLFYTNFVSTVDGKVSVKKEGYWPIGSKVDYHVLTELRAYADCLIHGGNLARQFGEITLKSLNKPEFKKLRRKLGKDELLPYYVISKNPQNLPSHLESGNTVVKDLQTLQSTIKIRGYRHVLVEGGPTLLASFLKEDLMDQIFLTIAPKIFGNTKGTTLTLVEGHLFSPDQIKRLKLLSLKKIGDEVFLRYSILGG